MKSVLKNDNYKKAELLSQVIIHSGLNPSEQVVGACLWYPVGHSENGIILFYTLKALPNGGLLRDSRIYQTFINYSTMANYCNLFENGYEDIRETGVCLTRSIVGTAQFILGNCQIYPSLFLKEEFKWEPTFSNPFIWINAEKEAVLRFERVIYPTRDTLHQHYHRQPMLFRWIANKHVLDNQLRYHRLETRSVYDIMPYDGIISTKED